VGKSQFSIIFTAHEFVSISSLTIPTTFHIDILRSRKAPEVEKVEKRGRKKKFSMCVGIYAYAYYAYDLGLDAT
jgi:hypothetical protein